MSRGLGRVERAILAVVEDACEERYAAETLALEIYQPEKPRRRPTQAERVAVFRAMHSLARKFPKKFVLNGGKGSEPLRLGRRDASV
jgi:hypothetical protein